MRAKINAVLRVLLALVFVAFLAALRFPHGSKPLEPIYRPVRHTVNLVKTDLSIGRGPVIREGVHLTQPPTVFDLALAIHQQDASNGLHGFNLLGWDFSVVLHDSGNGIVDYSLIAKRPGIQEYYYSVRTEIARGWVRVSASAPAAMRICADRTVISTDKECDDGSRSEPFVAR